MFICEACTVRAVLDRELTYQSRDRALLMLERMRILDTIHHWADGTHRAYQGKLRILRSFEQDFGLSILIPSQTPYPPNGPALELMWAQLRYSLQPSKWKRNPNTPLDTVKSGSIRALRSAASQFWALDLMLNNPQHLTTDAKDRPLLVAGCSPTDELSYSFFTDGMRRRLGDESKPSQALLDQHVRWIDVQMEHLYHASESVPSRIEACRVAITNLMGWLGWLRAMETFSIRWMDVDVVTPADGPTVGLPADVGMVNLRLLPQTKSDQTRTADMVLAYRTLSVYNLGHWLQRLRRLLNLGDT